MFFDDVVDVSVTEVPARTGVVVIEYPVTGEPPFTGGAVIEIVALVVLLVGTDALAAAGELGAIGVTPIDITAVPVSG
jgi:hypothetical protein